MYLYQFNIRIVDAEICEMVVLEGDKKLFKVVGHPTDLARIAAAFTVAAGNLKITVSQPQPSHEQTKTVDKPKVPVYKRPRKDVSTETKNAVLNVIKNLYSDGKLFHVKDIMDVLDDVSYSVVQAALGHLAHEGWLDKVQRGRKVYYRYTGKRKVQQVLG